MAQNRLSDTTERLAGLLPQVVNHKRTCMFVGLHVGLAYILYYKHV